MGGYYLLKSNGGDSGNRIFILNWRCPLIRVYVIRGSTVFRDLKILKENLLKLSCLT
jgi:hypothetical protein